MKTVDEKEKRVKQYLNQFLSIRRKYKRLNVDVEVKSLTITFTVNSGKNFDVDKWNQNIVKEKKDTAYLIQKSKAG